MRNLGFILMTIALLVLTACAHTLSPPKAKHGAAKTAPITVAPSKPAVPVAVAPAKPPALDDTAKQTALAALIETCTLVPQPANLKPGSSYYRRYAGRAGTTSVFRLISTTDLDKCLAYKVESTAYTDTGSNDIVDLPMF